MVQTCLLLYTQDFYVHEYWDKLPQCWKRSLKNCKLETIGRIIGLDESLEISEVLPLSMLALRQSIKYLQIPRKQQAVNIDATSQKGPNPSLCDKNIFSVNHFRNVFWKRVKLKKKHEIELMSKMCYKLAIKTNCYYIIDVGSGIGHLSRMLSYGYGLKVCGLEAQKYLTEEAKKLDQEMEHALKKYCNETPTKYVKPIHVNMRVKTNSNGEDILKTAEEAFSIKSDDLQFGIVGLHPCGDLGATLMRLFINYPQVKFINIVGCCYMKLSEPTSSLHGGYPLSNFCKEKNYKLSYASREVACHALEAYVDKLNSNEYWQLKIHAYRAVLEKLIVDDWPDLFHSQVNSVKYYENLSFSEYCFKAISRLGIKLNKTKMESSETARYLQDWNYVVIFYSLRLMIAPLVETIIMLDRILFIIESDYTCGATSIFDPQLSPRNQILTAIK